MSTIKNFVCKSRRLRIFLQNKGLECKVQQDRADGSKDVYIFTNSELLQTLVNEYMNDDARYNNTGFIKDKNVKSVINASCF